MTTIGYGDYYPKTMSGRIVAFVLCVWGVIVVSLMVVSLSNYVLYDNNQKQADFMMKKLKMKEEVRDCAARLIGITWRVFYWHSKDNSFSRNIKFWQNVRKFRLAFMKLKQAKRNLRNHVIECDLFDRFIVENDLLRNDMLTIQKDSRRILEGATRLNSQVASLMAMHGKKDATVKGSMGVAKKAAARRPSELSLGKFNCVFASHVSKEQLERSQHPEVNKMREDPNKTVKARQGN